MSFTEVESFFVALGFEEVDFEDGQAFFYDLGDSRYGLVTDEEGLLPSSLADSLYWTLYGEQNEFCWSVSLENALQLQAILDVKPTAEELLKALAQLRADNMIEFNI